MGFKIYNASAGSGKTFTLVSSFLKRILESNNPMAFSHLLAITFTNKAVGEMKERIIESLADFMNSPKNSPMLEILSKDLNTSKEELGYRSKNILKNILHHYSFLNISTIDKFNHRIIRSFAYDLNLPLSFKVEIDSKYYLTKAVENLIEKSGEVTHEKISKRLITFIDYKIGHDRSETIERDLKNIANILLEENHYENLKHISSKSLSDFERLEANINQRIVSERKIMQDICSRFSSLLSENNLEDGDFSRQSIPKFVNTARENRLEPKSFDAKTFTEIETANLYNKTLEDYKKSTIENIRPSLISIFEDIKSCYFKQELYNDFLNACLPLSLVSEIDKELQLIKSEEDLVFIADFNRKIHEIIKGFPTPFIYEQLSEKFRHYFIDEFQDTSVMQWSNIIPLIKDAVESGNNKEQGSLFLVGDIKQSIYRFRGGNPEQFIKLVKNNNNPFSISHQFENLTTNYRSTKNIVLFNNTLFETISDSILTNKNHLKFYKNDNLLQHYNNNEGGGIEIHFVENNTEESVEELYLEKTLLTINNILQTEKYSPNDICILVSKNTQIRAISNFLIENNIDVSTSESFLLKNDLSVFFLITLMKWATSPEDKKNIYEILWILSENKNHKHDFIATHLKDFDLFLATEFGFYLKDFSRKNILNAIRWAIQCFNIVASPYVIELLDTLNDFSKQKKGGFFRFLEYWGQIEDSKTASITLSSHSVQIMTIHKAKGLEFPIVLMPYCDKSIYRENSPVTWYPLENSIFNHLLINKKTSMRHYGKIGTDIINKKREEMELDGLNVLYVACTRAIDQLHIISNNNFSKNGIQKYNDLLKLFLEKKKLWEENKSTYTFGDLNSKRFSKKHANKNTNISLMFGNSLQKPPKMRYIHQTKFTEKGILLHTIFAKIRTKKDIQRVQQNIIPNLNIEDEEKELYNNLVSEVINHAELKKFFEESRVYIEREFLTPNKLIIKPDRLQENKDHTWTLIDFKSGEKRPSHIEQLNHYQQVLEHNNYKIRDNILIYLQNPLEVVYV